MEDSSKIKSWWWWETHKQTAVIRPAKQTQEWNYKCCARRGIFPACVGYTHAPSIQSESTVSHTRAACVNTQRWRNWPEAALMTKADVFSFALCVKPNNVLWIWLNMRKTLLWIQNSHYKSTDAFIAFRNRENCYRLPNQDAWVWAAAHDVTVALSTVAYLLTDKSHMS